MLTPDEIRADFRHYEDSQGVLHHVWGPDDNQSGNGQLYDALKLWTYKKRGMLTTNDQYGFNLMLLLCQIKFSLFKRASYGWNESQNSMDNYIGILSVPFSCRKDSIYGYGKNHWDIFNNQHPGKFTFRAWFGRNRAFMAHMKYAVDKRPCWIDRFAWRWSVRRSMRRPRGDQDARTLTWLLIETYKMSGRREVKHDALCDTWEEKLYETYPGGMGQVLGEYFNNMSHPLARYFIT